MFIDDFLTHKMGKIKWNRDLTSKQASESECVRVCVRIWKNGEIVYRKWVNTN